MSASAFSLSAAIPSAAFLVIQGEPVIGGLHGPTRHFFCRYCMSWMFTRPDGFDAIVNVRVTMLDDPRPFPPFIETYTSEKLPWASTPAVRSLEKFPAFEEYEGLARDYAAQARRGRLSGTSTFAPRSGHFVGGRRHKLSTAEVNSMAIKMLKDR